jgi:hypothetical protein
MSKKKKNINSNLIRTIDLGDYLIEIYHNILLKNNPYLVRIFSYDTETIELRLEKKDIKNLCKTLKEYKLI